MDKTQAQKIGNTIAEALVSSSKEEPKTPPRASKQEEYLRNEQARTELIAKNTPKTAPISRDLDLDFPLTSPADKQRAGRITTDAEGGFGKPYPQGSNLAPLPSTVAAEPAPQTESEFKESGGEGFRETADIDPDTSKGTPVTTDNVTDIEARERAAKADAKADAKAPAKK